MKRITVTNEEIQEWQATTWKTYCCQDQVYLECNLLGYFKVRDKEELRPWVTVETLETAKQLYMDTLINKGVPEYKIAVEFVV